MCLDIFHGQLSPLHDLALVFSIQLGSKSTKKPYCVLDTLGALGIAISVLSSDMDAC